MKAFLVFICSLFLSNFALASTDCKVRVRDHFWQKVTDETSSFVCSKVINTLVEEKVYIGKNGRIDIWVGYSSGDRSVSFRLIDNSKEITGYGVMAQVDAGIFEYRLDKIISSEK